MKRPIIVLSSALLIWATGAQAQGVGPWGVPGSAGAPNGTPATAPASTPSNPINLTGVQNATFGNPRSSNDGSLTRVVFDLAQGVTYTLTPTFTGLRLDVQGARVLPAVVARFGNSVIEYRAGGGQVMLVTPFPLSLTEGWKASEATLANGGRVLILELSPTISGGASEALRAAVRPISPAAQTGTNAAGPNTQPTAGGSGLGALSTSGTAGSSSTPGTATSAMQDQSLPPGDTINNSGKVLPPAPALPGSNTEVPSALSGKVPGTASGALVDRPRIGKNPGQTRVVLDLPPGTAYRIVPGGLGLRVELTGVNVAPQTAQNISPEVRAWKYEQTAVGANITFLTGTPTSARSGWRAQLLPPGNGSDRSRLAIDLSPALADLTPLSPAEAAVGFVPPVTAARGTAILALSASLVKPRVVIDPGHGGKDPGAIGSVTEKDVTLDVALRVRDLLTAAGVDVVMTRESDTALHPSKNTDLEMRAGMGTPGTMLFVSIHVNSMDARNALRGYGIETWWNPNHQLSSSLAAILQDRMVTVTGAFNQGLKTGRSLSVLRNSRIPAALVEIGYASHPVDGLNLLDENYRQRVALGIALGIRDALLTGITATGAVGGAGK